MILLKRKKTFIGGICLCLLILLIYSGSLFNEKRAFVLSEMHQLCDRAIRQDCENRLKEENTSFSSGYRVSDRDSVTVSSMEGSVEKIVKKTKEVDLLFEEKQYRVTQSFLLMKNPIDVVVLDSFFYLALRQREMGNVRAALIYIANNDTMYSNPDAAFYQSASALPPFRTGVHDEIFLQAYVDVPFFTVINQNKVHFIILLTICCLILCFLLIIRYNKRFMVPVQEQTGELIQIKENLLFDKEKGILYSDDTIQVAFSNYKLKIFILLLESPDHFRKTDAIQMAVWGNVTTTDKLNMTISRLRKVLEPIPALKIVSESGGYRLCISPANRE